MGLRRERVVLLDVEGRRAVVRPAQNARPLVERVEEAVDADGEDGVAGDQRGGVRAGAGGVQPDVEVPVVHERRVVGVLPARGAGSSVERDDDLLVVLAVHRDEQVAVGKNGGARGGGRGDDLRLARPPVDLAYRQGIDRHLVDAGHRAERAGDQMQLVLDDEVGRRERRLETLSRSRLGGTVESSLFETGRPLRAARRPVPPTAARRTCPPSRSGTPAAAGRSVRPRRRSAAGGRR